MGRAETITAAVRKYDPELYCEKSKEGKLCVWRKSKRWESYDVDGTVIQFARPAPFLIFALTDNWRFDGREVEWGILPILERLKAMDLWKHDLAEKCIQETEKANESKERDARNSIESFLYEFRSQFKRTFSDVNTANMNKTEKLGE